MRHARDDVLLKQLVLEWHHANWTHLSRALRPPVIALCEDRSLLGQWVPDRRTILLDRELVRSGPWEQVLEVLRHEMAHQYAHEVLGARGERPHGTAFEHGLRRLGVDRVAAGLQHPEAAEARVVRRVRKLLSLASSSNQHEAENAMAKAQQLMLDHNISLAGAHQEYRSRVVGPRKLRFQRWEQLLVSLLTEHFFVDAIWIRVYLRDRDRQGQVLELMGTPANLDMAEYVHRFLTDTAARLYGAWAPTRAVKRRSDKGQFHNGVMLGFRAKLERERKRHEEAGLVWVGDAGLDDFFSERHPRVERRRRSRIRGGRAYAAGHRAGGDIVLNRPLSQGPGRGPRRLLGD